MKTQIGICDNVAQPGSTLINNVQLSTSHSVDEINQACLHALRYHDPFEIKIRLKESKDKLIDQCFDWILQTSEYTRWQDGKDVGLLWIKGGAGKGKTMMSIGLIEKLSQTPKVDSMVTYFFCQNADTNLNSVEAILKGLILQLVRQQESLKSILRSRWDVKRETFIDGMGHWRGLWNVFLEMLDCCACPKLFVILDALDECHDENLAILLRLIVRTGLSTRVRWLLTSRPLDKAGQELLTGSDQELVSLDLNDEHISRGVAIYVSNKVAELNRRWASGPTNMQEIEMKLAQKAEGNMLWVSLVCKRLEIVSRKEALAVIDDLPPDLYSFYGRAHRELCCSQSPTSKGCTQLLQVMMLTFRPLHLQEIPSVTGFCAEKWEIEALIERSNSFVKRRGDIVEFIHESARDFLAELYDRPTVAPEDRIDHGHVAANCLLYLTQHLKLNLLDLTQPVGIQELSAQRANDLLIRLRYAAVFWPRHLEVAADTTAYPQILVKDGILDRFFNTRFLEWLECLSLSDHLSSAIRALEIVSSIFSSQKWNPQPFSVVFVQDAQLVLLRHYRAISSLPAHFYASAIIFSPRSSIVRQANLDRIPSWLTQFSTIEENWSSLGLTIRAHLGTVHSVIFSPDGRHIASASLEDGINVWDAITGEIQRGIHFDLGPHSNSITYSSDGQCIAYCGKASIQIWDLQKRRVRLSLADDLPHLTDVAISQDSRFIAARFADLPVDCSIQKRKFKVWVTITGEVVSTRTNFTGNADLSIHHLMAFSPNGQSIVSRNGCGMTLIQDIATGEIIREFDSRPVDDLGPALAFSPDGSHIASIERDETCGFPGFHVQVWSSETGERQLVLKDYTTITCLAYSSDGRYLATGSDNGTIGIWNTTTGRLESTFAGHVSAVRSVAFSPDGRRAVSGSDDSTVRIWNLGQEPTKRSSLSLLAGVPAFGLSSNSQLLFRTGDLGGGLKVCDAVSGEDKMILEQDSFHWRSVASSPDGLQVAAGSEPSWSAVVNIWDLTTGLLLRQLPAGAEVHVLAYSSDSKFLAAGCSEHVRSTSVTTIAVWDIATGEVEQTLICQQTRTHADKFEYGLQKVAAVSFSHDRRRLAAATSSSRADRHTVEIWDLAQPVSRWSEIGKMLRRRHETKPSQVIKVDSSISMLRFTSDDASLMTEYGIIEVGQTVKPQFSSVREFPPYLHIRDQCLYFGDQLLLMSPANFKMNSHDISKDRVAIAFEDCQAATFDIDTKALRLPPEFGLERSTSVGETK